jgi:hypothetical protein
MEELVAFRLTLRNSWLDVNSEIRVCSLGENDGIDASPHRRSLQSVFYHSVGGTHTSAQSLSHASISCSKPSENKSFCERMTMSMTAWAFSKA